MKRRLAIIGMGRVGHACAAAIRAANDLALVAVVRRPETVGQALPAAFADVAIVTDLNEAGPVDAALVCRPTEPALECVKILVRHGVPSVDSLPLHGEALQSHVQDIARLAARHRVAAVAGAGWDPGILSLVRSLFALAVPKGMTEGQGHAGEHLHHSLAACNVTGVREALSTEQLAADGGRQRYVYVELEAGADIEKIASQIRADPLFIGEQTLVFAVDSAAALEDADSEMALYRRGAAGGVAHQFLMFEGRIDRAAVTAQAMVAAARATAWLSPGAYTLADLPLSTLWGAKRPEAMLRWV